MRVVGGGVGGGNLCEGTVFLRKSKIGGAGRAFGIDCAFCLCYSVQTSSHL